MIGPAWPPRLTAVNARRARAGQHGGGRPPCPAPRRAPCSRHRSPEV